MTHNSHLNALTKTQVINMEHSQSLYNQLKTVQLSYDLSLNHIRSLYKTRIGKWPSKKIEEYWGYEKVTDDVIEYMNTIKREYCEDHGYEFIHPYMKSWCDHELFRLHRIK